MFLGTSAKFIRAFVELGGFATWKSRCQSLHVKFKCFGKVHQQWPNNSLVQKADVYHFHQAVMASFYPTSQLVTWTLLCLLAHYVCLVIYRLYLSPLRMIPGPKLAAATYLHEFYYDAICNGRYLWKIRELHQQYGPIVRINPGEVHINDVTFYDQIYASKPQDARNKIRFMAMHDQTMFDTYDADQHRARRSAMAASFSKQSIQALEPTIRETAKQLVARLKLASTTGIVVNLKEYYSGLTMDVIAFYCFGKRMDGLRQEDFGPALLDAFASLPRGHPVGRMFPWVFDVLQKVPARIVALLDSKFKPLAEYEQRIDGQIKAVLEQEKPAGLRTVFHQVRDSRHLPRSDKTLARFKSEAAIFFGAGTETTASALTTMTFFLTSNKTMLRRVRAELKEAALQQPGTPLSVARLESLPYLVSVVNVRGTILPPDTDYQAEGRGS